jgi:hypothetical protein
MLDVRAPGGRPGDNAQSVGVHVTFGEFRGLHLGDLTVNQEFDLMCPTNPIGAVDLYMVSHHGSGSSNAPVLVHAIAPRVAIMNNGTRKGGTPDSMTTLHTAPRLQDLWQLHFSVLSGQEYTVPGVFIANLVDDQSDTMPLSPMPQPRRGSTAGARRGGALDQGGGASRRHVHRDEQSERLR